MDALVNIVFGDAELLPGTQSVNGVWLQLVGVFNLICSLDLKIIPVVFQKAVQLKKWIAIEDNMHRVVYACFGSMVVVDDNFVP